MAGYSRKRGDTWYYCIDIGKVAGVRKRIERGGFKTKREAELAKNKALYELEQNGSYVDESKMSLSDFLDYWFDEYVMLNCSYYTQISRKTTIKFLKEHIGNYSLKALTSIRIQKFINDAYKSDMAYSTLKLRVEVLKNALKYAVYPCEFLKVNAAEHLKLPPKKEEKEKTNIIDLKTFNKIIDSISIRQTKFKIAFLLAFHTGMRLSEVCGLTWDKIDMINKEIKVEHILIYRDKEFFLASPKTKTSNRIIAIGPTLLKILELERARQIELRKEFAEYYFIHESKKEFVCCHNEGKPIIPNTLKFFCIDKISKQHNIKFNFHMLRHTHATMLLEAGANIKEISTRLGHSNTNITLDVYSHVTAKMKNDTVNIFEKIIK